MARLSYGSREPDGYRALVLAVVEEQELGQYRSAQLAFCGRWVSIPGQLRGVGFARSMVVVAQRALMVALEESRSASGVEWSGV